MDQLEDPRDRCEELFPQVLPVLLKWSKMDREIFFNSRAVSTKCCLAVSKYINDLWDWKLFDGKNRDVAIKFYLLKVRAGFVTREDMVTYFENVLGPKRDYNRAPLIMKSLVACFLRDGQEELPRQMFPLIQRVGEILRKIRFEVRFTTFQETREFIRWTFENCPNLEIFEFNKHNDGKEADEEDNLEEVTALPPHQNLKYLRFFASSRNHVKLVNLFKNSFSTLKVIEIPLVVAAQIEWNEFVFEKLRVLILVKIQLLAASQTNATLDLLQNIKAPNLNSLQFITILPVEDIDDLSTPVEIMQLFSMEVESILREGYPGHHVKTCIQPPFPDGDQALGLYSTYTLIRRQ